MGFPSRLCVNELSMSLRSSLKDYYLDGFYIYSLHLFFMIFSKRLSLWRLLSELAFSHPFFSPLPKGTRQSVLPRWQLSSLYRCVPTLPLTPHRKIVASTCQRILLSTSRSPEEGDHATRHDDGRHPWLLGPNLPFHHFKLVAFVGLILNADAQAHDALNASPTLPLSTASGHWFMHRWLHGGA